MIIPFTIELRDAHAHSRFRIIAILISLQSGWNILEEPILNSPRWLFSQIGPELTSSIKEAKDRRNPESQTDNRSIDPRVGELPRLTRRRASRVIDVIDGEVFSKSYSRNTFLRLSNMFNVARLRLVELLGLTRLKVLLHPPPLPRVDESRASRYQEEYYAGANREDQGTSLPVPQQVALARGFSPLPRIMCRLDRKVSVTHVAALTLR